MKVRDVCNCLINENVISLWHLPLFDLKSKGKEGYIFGMEKCERAVLQSFPVTLPFSSDRQIST